MAGVAVPLTISVVAISVVAVSIPVAVTVRVAIAIESVRIAPAPPPRKAEGTYKDDIIMIVMVVLIAAPVAAIPIVASPIAAVPVVAAPRAHSRTAAHSGARTHRGEMMTATTTARCSRENWRSQHHCNKASQEKQKFRIIHNRSGFLSTSLDTARDSKSRFIFTVAEN